MKSVYEIQQFLKRYGTIIYVGDRLADMELMEDELKEMFNSQLIERNEFENALMLLRHEIQLEKEKNNRKGDRK
ncbi:cytosolic protein [Bacillus sp. FJAT-27225]|uniref:YqgQ family protein n=1 Tax=Bacillus sp. FJAT-27225 TaxID=1743144 RepID=UPI00080C24CE|nr:YqgQ family protein [Bacillus sp. FJAT-27225]OCA91557.1 cytosolic protein [Bacillus sp. FJAT-27225]